MWEQQYEEERFHDRDTIFFRGTLFEQSPSRTAMDEMWRPPAFPNLLWAEEVRKFCQHWGGWAQQPKVVQRSVNVLVGRYRWVSQIGSPRSFTEAARHNRGMVCRRGYVNHIAIFLGICGWFVLEMVHFHISSLISTRSKRLWFPFQCQRMSLRWSLNTVFSSQASLRYWIRTSKTAQISI